MDRYLTLSGWSAIVAGILLASVLAAQEAPAPPEAPAAKPVAEGKAPEPLDSETRLWLSEKVILIQNHQSQIQELNQRLQSLLAEYNETVAKLRKEHKAEGCQLSAAQSWINCPTPTTEDAPKPPAEKPAETP